MKIHVHRRPLSGRRRVGAPHVLGGVCVAALALAWIVSGAGMIIHSIAVSGNRYLSAAEIIRMTGLPEKARLSRAESRKIRARLMGHPAFKKVSVSRRLGGDLSIKVVEREPEAWLVSHNCAVSREGVLLPHIQSRSPDLTPVDGFPVEHGVISLPELLLEAGKGKMMARDLAEGAEGTWRYLSSKPSCWELTLERKRILLSSPLREEEFERLRVLKAEFPDAWRRAGGLDLRFQDRVVMKR